MTRTVLDLETSSSASQYTDPELTGAFAGQEQARFQGGNSTSAGPRKQNYSSLSSSGVTCLRNEIICPEKSKCPEKSLKLVPEILELLSEGELVSSIEAASDWSYSAPSYASRYVYISGDAGCFTDPFFSSGVHLALAGSRLAALTICAAVRGDCHEVTSAKWHSSKVAEGYARFPACDLERPQAN
jgi:hypothetical protein